MDILKLLSHFESFDQDVYDRFDTRRKAMSKFANIGKKLTLATLPLAASAMINRAYGGTNDAVQDALQLALKAEYFEAEFYTYVLNHNTALPSTLITGIRRIAYDELLHIEAVKATLIGLGGTPAIPYTGKSTDRPSTANYGIDITGGGGGATNGMGPLASVVTSVDDFLSVAQALEDNGVRAYKGQAANIFANKAVLGAGLGIHSIEARHASFLRYTRSTLGVAVTPWVSGKDPVIANTAIASGVAPLYGAGADPAAYPAEDNTTQATVNILTLTGGNAAQASASFDEPLDGATVTKYLQGQVVSNLTFLY